MIVTQHLTRKFSAGKNREPITAVDDLTVEIKEGEVFGFLGPLFGEIAGVILIMVLLQVLVFRKRKANPYEPGTQRSYGIAGGSICSKCDRPTPRHIWGMNLELAKFDRCENCGKWSVMRAMPLERLRAAEEAEKPDEGGVIGKTDQSPEDELRELLNKSKYE
jgi:hypothetical protein